MKRTIEYIAEYPCQSIRNYLRQQGLSRAGIIRLKQCDGGILLNGEPAFVNRPVEIGDVIQLTFAQEHPDYEADPSLPFVIVMENQDYLMVDKPAGMAVHPTSTIADGTLLNAFAAYCEQQKTSCVFRPINRLDRNTSGLVLLAKHKAAATMAKGMDKEYLAICHGITPENGTIDKNIAVSKDSFIKREISPLGQSAVTHFETLASTDQFSIVKLCLDTGRTHQIRVHMASIGHPLLGDDLYGGGSDSFERHALHCARISFISNITDETISVRCSMPADMLEWIHSNFDGLWSEDFVY